MENVNCLDSSGAHVFFAIFASLLLFFFSNLLCCSKSLKFVSGTNKSKVNLFPFALALWTEMLSDSHIAIWTLISANISTSIASLCCGLLTKIWTAFKLIQILNKSQIYFSVKFFWRQFKVTRCWFDCPIICKIWKKKTKKIFFSNM